MTSVFADTSFWLARTDPRDQWAIAARRALASVLESQFVTADFVLVEFLNALSRYGPAVRSAGIRATRAILSSATVVVVEASRQPLLEALDLFARRGDKSYSLTDCISMNEMRRRRISRVLTSDRNFEQEGFVILMRQ
jgi:predicted nucleic acid-binding protein